MLGVVLLRCAAAFIVVCVYAVLRIYACSRLTASWKRMCIMSYPYTPIIATPSSPPTATLPTLRQVGNCMQHAGKSPLHGRKFCLSTANVYLSILTTGSSNGSKWLYLTRLTAGAVC